MDRGTPVHEPDPEHLAAFDMGIAGGEFNRVDARPVEMDLGL